ncbi:MAG: hypothetical protein IRY99_20590 [Isosphaeraceae bacterium]|nr:hypothetical protein [Isosphaeraceae bacterium]
MRTLTAIVALLLVAGVAQAQERLPADQAEKYAKLFVERARSLEDLPLKVEADPQKADALHDQDHGAMVIPAKGLLSEEAIRKDAEGGKVVPLGQLWFRNVTPMVDGQAVPNDKLRIIPVNIEGNDHDLPLLLLGVRKDPDGKWEMVVYAKDKEPLLRLPIQRAPEGSADQPLALDAAKKDDRGELTIRVLGKYQAVMTVTEQAP